MPNNPVGWDKNQVCTEAEKISANADGLKRSRGVKGYVDLDSINDSLTVRSGK